MVKKIIGNDVKFRRENDAIYFDIQYAASLTGPQHFSGSFEHEIVRRDDT
jgi:hypothetical protein